MKHALSRRELEDRLDDMLFTVLSARRTAASLAGGLAELGRAQQDLALHWVHVAAQNTGELGFQVASMMPQALAAFDRAGVERWVLDALDVYDREGLHAASASLRDFGAFRRRVEGERAGVSLSEMARTLELFLRGLSGRSMGVEPADIAWTDTDTVFLPERIGARPDRESNRGLYVATAAFLWGQARYGTFNADLDAAADAASSDRERAIAWIAVLESMRIEGWFARQYPGLAGKLRELRAPWPEALAPVAESLAMEGASIEDTVALLRDVARDAPPAPPPWAGVLRVSRARRAREERMEREKKDLSKQIDALRESLKGEGLQPDDLQLEASYDTMEVSASLDGDSVEVSELVEQLVQSMMQDHGRVPDDLMAPSVDGTYAADAGASPPQEGGRAPDEHKEGGILYPEWDHRRGDYRKEWCALFESDVPPGDAGYVDRVKEKYRGPIAQLKRRFEALRGEDRLLRREPDGDGIDFDAVVEAWAEAKTGREPSDRLFTRRRRTERNIAAMFMVDMSGSTKGWINECEREALVMLCEALETLGDRYAIYGFSGWTRKRCEIYRVKTFDETLSPAVRARIAGVAPKDYTRMGVAVRHLTKLLNKVDARTRVLFTLSDGKPDDFHDGYRGAYGIEDTRKALIEARLSGVHPFCITIDREARDYLPRLYGPASWTIVDDVTQLPMKSAEIYRRLTA